MPSIGGTNNPGPFRVDGVDPFQFGLPPISGKWWYVKGGSGTGSPIAGSGSDGNRGDSWDEAFLTMAKVFNHPEFHSGDGIRFIGNIREELSTPAGVFDVTVVGQRTRHADAHGADVSWGGYSSSTWKTPASPTAATPLLIVRQQGWSFYNILWDGPSDAAAVQLFRDAGADDAEDDASHAKFVGCKFVAAQNHIEFKGGLSQVEIYNNLFFGATADSLLETTGAGVGTNNYFRIMNNIWHGCDTAIDVALNDATIAGNIVGVRSGSAAYIDLTGGARNVVTMNHLSGTYSNAGGYTAGTNDEWGGNFNSISGGVTAADPA